MILICFTIGKLALSDIGFIADNTARIVDKRCWLDFLVGALEDIKQNGTLSCNRRFSKLERCWILTLPPLRGIVPTSAERARLSE